MSAPTLQTVMDLIDGRTDELVALTQDLIRFPTINPPGEAYRPCAEYIGERLKKRGFTVEYVRGEGSPGDSDQYPRTNVIARWTGSEPGPCVHFNSHIDVVEVGAGWTVDPFGGEVKDGRVYGRGACDMKGGLAASIIAVEALIDSGLPLPGALEISGTVDEESGGYGGVAYLLPAPCVADSSRMVIDRRFLIEETLEDVKGEVKAILDGLAAQRHGFRYEMRDLFQVAPSMADRDGPVASTTAAAIETVLGKKAQFVCSPGTYDQKHIDRIGKLKDCIAYGPGVLDLAHQPDEWVGIDDMTNSAKVMARAAYDLLTRKRS
ncbi:MAG: M20/M25/M40 family metallo-hydrolase [Brevundimonas diminuta]|nr:M20/M25/M40 family metallo-hydrolase [Brevundimonas diminuta]MBD3818864.1 M20/M25/M40 family metallo-hydrolase [Brevundimonas diminuta]